MTTAIWSIQTRLLHLGLALTVTLQLAVSLVMEAPDHEDASEVALAAFEAHEFIGMAALLVVALHWLWSLASRADGGLSHLFPWGGAALTQVKIDVSKLFKGQLPEGGPRGGLPGLVHGLGFLAVTAMAISGGILFFIFPETGEPGKNVEAVAEVHEFIATFVWIYWGAHIALGVLHKRAGHSTILDMFSFKS
jgi:cytochrome b561